MKKNFLKITVIAGIFTLLMAACQNNGQGQYETIAAAKGSLSATVGATGTVRSNQSAELNWQTTGTVDKVNVKIGDQVKIDDVLATLRLDSVPALVVTGPSDLATAQRDLQDMLNSEKSMTQAQLDVIAAQKAVETAQNNWDAMAFPRATNVLIQNTQAKIWDAEKKLTLANKAYKEVQHHPDGDPQKTAALLALTNAQLALNDLVATYNWYVGKPTQEDYNKTKAQLADARAALDDAKRRRDNVKDGADPLKIAAAKSRIAAAQATVNLVRIVAPFNATVTDAQPLPGDQVAPGKIAFRLDDTSHLKVDVEVSEIDINAIKIDQPVGVTFDAVLGKDYKGVVKEVSQAGTVVQGAVNFTVTVELTDADAAVKPGMTAAITILVKQLNDVLLVPNRAVRVVDGNRVVYVLKNNIPTEVKITLGATSDVNSEVAGGDLNIGDLIILNPPATFNGPPAGRPGGSGGN
jgi:HlyD family secretion protein